MRKKVLIMIPTLLGGGAEKVLVDILNNLSVENYDINLHLIQNEGYYFDNLNNNINVKSYFTPSKNKKIRFFQLVILYKYIKYFPKRFYKKFIKEEFDVEIAFLEGAATKIISNSTNNKSKKIAWVHSDLLNNHWTRRMYKKNEEYSCYKKFNDIVFVSEDARKAFNRLFNCIKNNKRVILNPIFKDEILEKSNQFDIKFDTFTILSVGRLDEQKGYDRLIRAHSKIYSKYPHRLIIIGEGNQKIELENLIDELNVSNSVMLTGFLKNPYPYIKAADLIVSSSRVEGYPLALLESICLEKPIVATNITGNREILDNGKYGIICDNSILGIEEGISKILREDKIDYYSKKSKERMESFDYRKIIKDIESLINS